MIRFLKRKKIVKEPVDLPLFGITGYQEYFRTETILQYQDPHTLEWIDAETVEEDEDSKKDSTPIQN
jgi:hypothetical protein